MKQVQMIPFGNLRVQKHPFRLVSMRSVEMLAEDIKTRGLVYPLTVRENMMIIDGVHRYFAIMRLRETEPEKWDMIPCYVI